MNDNGPEKQDGGAEEAAPDTPSAIPPGESASEQGETPPPIPAQAPATSAASDLVSKYKQLPPAVQILIPVVLALGMLTTCCCGGCIIFFGDKDDKIDEDDVDAKVSARQLYRDYDSNEVSADDKYKGKILEVTGSVVSVSKGAFDKVYIALDHGSALPGVLGLVRCYVISDEEDDAGKLRKGQRVTVRGKCDGMTLGHVQLKNCAIVD